MNTYFSKFSYKEAKEFLKDAEIVSFNVTPTICITNYKKPNGTKWYEYERTLWSAEWDYYLIYREEN